MKQAMSSVFHLSGNLGQWISGIGVALWHNGAYMEVDDVIEYQSMSRGYVVMGEWRIALL